MQSILTNLYANLVRLTSARLTCCVQKPLLFSPAPDKVWLPLHLRRAQLTRALYSGGGRSRKFIAGLDKFDPKSTKLQPTQEIFSIPVESFHPLPLRGPRSTGRDSSAKPLRNKIQSVASGANNFSRIDYLDERGEGLSSIERNCMQRY